MLPRKREPSTYYKKQALAELLRRFGFEVDPYRFQYLQRCGLIGDPVRILRGGQTRGARGVWPAEVVERLAVVCALSGIGWNTTKIKWAIENVDEEFARPKGPSDRSLRTLIAALPKEVWDSIEMWKPQIATQFAVVRALAAAGYRLNPLPDVAATVKYEIKSGGGGSIKVALLAPDGEANGSDADGTHSGGEEPR